MYFTDKDNHHQYTIDVEFYSPGATFNFTTASGVSQPFPMTGFIIHLRRRKAPFLNKVFGPLAVLVYISMMSFNIAAECVPGRMSLLMTIFLMIINTSNSARNSSPSGASISWLDVWLFLVFTTEVSRILADPLMLSHLV